MAAEFETLMNKVCSGLHLGAMWNAKAATECQKIGVRGMARWHNFASEHDHCDLLKLQKILMDKLDYAPVIDTAPAAKAATYEIADIKALRSHIQEWINMEDDFTTILNDAIKASAPEDIQVYKEIMCLTDQTQDEAMRLNLLDKRLSLSDYNGHDIGVVSYLLHSHFEGGGDSYNVNLG